MNAPRSPAEPLPRIDVTTWSDAGSRDALDLVAASAAELVGFGVATVSVARGDHLYTVSVHGSSEAAEALLGLATPVALVRPELDMGDDWGRFRFVPHGRNEAGLDDFMWVPDLTPVEAPDAWHPLDLLLAPLHDEAARFIGLLSIDVPSSGLRPDAREREVLQRYAAQVERVLRMAVERDELSERIRLTEAARRVVRFATSQDDLEGVVDDCRGPILEGFRADFLAIRIYPTHDLPAAGSPPTDLPSEVVETIRGVARACWTEQRVVVAGEGIPAPVDDAHVDEATYRTMLRAMAHVGMSSVMVVPLGAGHQSLGHLILGRREQEPRWSADERAAALDVSRDIGQAIADSRSRARGQRLVRDLQQLATYKTQVLHTVSHELKNPLAAVTGYLEILQSDPTLAGSQRSLDAIERASSRMVRLVDDLLLLAQVEDPERGRSAEVVDAVAVTLEALHATRDAARQRGIALDVSAPAGPALVTCNPADLDRVLANLVSNAIKYSSDGATVSVRLAETRDPDEVEIEVVDRGLGISVEDQDRLFAEFFRSTNPEALAQPGTGLGLTICRRIVEQHDGRIEVESALGAGSTFRVFLPAAAEAS